MQLIHIDKSFYSEAINRVVHQNITAIRAEQLPLWQIQLLCIANDTQLDYHLGIPIIPITTITTTMEEKEND